MRDQNTEDAHLPAVNYTLLNPRPAPDDRDDQEFSLGELLATCARPVRSVAGVGTDNPQPSSSPYEVAYMPAVVHPSITPRFISESLALDDNTHVQQSREAVLDAFDAFNVPPLHAAVLPVVEACFASYNLANASPQQAQSAQMPSPALLLAPATQYEGLPTAASVDRRPQTAVSTMHEAARSLIECRRSNPQPWQTSLTEIPAAHPEGLFAASMDLYPGRWSPPADPAARLRNDIQAPAGTLDTMLPQYPVQYVHSSPPYASCRYAGQNFADSVRPTTQYEGRPAAPANFGPHSIVGSSIVPAGRMMHESTRSLIKSHQSNLLPQETSLTEIPAAAAYPEELFPASVNPYPRRWSPPADLEVRLRNGIQGTAEALGDILPQFSMQDVRRFSLYGSHQYASNMFVDNTAPFQAAGQQMGSSALSSARASNNYLFPPFPLPPPQSARPTGCIPGVGRAAQVSPDMMPPASHGYKGQPSSSEYPMHGTPDNITVILPPARLARVSVTANSSEHNAVPSSSSHGVSYDRSAGLPPVSAKRLGKMKEMPITPVTFTSASTSAGIGSARTNKEHPSYSLRYRKEAKFSPSSSSARGIGPVPHFLSPGSSVPVLEQSSSSFMHAGKLVIRRPDKLKIRAVNPTVFGRPKEHLSSTPIHSPCEYAGGPDSWASGAMKQDPSVHDPPLASSDEASTPLVAALQTIKVNRCPVVGCTTKAKLLRSDSLQRHLKTFHPRYADQLVAQLASLPPDHPLKRQKGHWAAAGLGIMLSDDAKEERDKVPPYDC